MQTTFALAALAAVAYAMPQGVTGDITPTASAPAGFSSSYNGQFEISIYKTSSKRSLTERASTCGTAGYLTLTLAGGQLHDAQGRTGYIAANYQFQFDAPPQTGAIYTGGFSVGSNGSLALGSSAVFYECLSGTFYNLYDRSWAAQCEPILIGIVPCGTVGQASDGQPTGTGAAAPPVTQISDGQPQGTSAVPVPVSEFTDGQPQVITAYPKPVTQISDGQVQAPTATGPAVTQISDGQVQAPSATGKPVTQISDGQVQAPSATVAPVTQISDGQVQAPSATVAPVTQISDGQVQAPTATVAPVTQISDGQIQAPTSSVAVVTQISDGQVQATGAANATKTPVPFTGAGNTVVASSFAALIMGAAAMLLL
ncbi:putative cell wall manno protein PIR3 [Stipitochalara longipes BDJ]|nr:putative cell wall manno protein PIR3 [Stipitochalara longipes BDJ]